VKVARYQKRENDEGGASTKDKTGRSRFLRGMFLSPNASQTPAIARTTHVAIKKGIISGWGVIDLSVYSNSAPRLALVMTRLLPFASGRSWGNQRFVRA